jgi:hypothetical protein
MGLKKLTKWAPFLSGLAAKVNELIDSALHHGDIKGVNGIRVIDAGPGGNLLIDGKDLIGGTNGIPPGTTVNDLLRWDGTNWVVFPASSPEGKWVLGIVDGVMTWMQTEGCTE